MLLSTVLLLIACLTIKTYEVVAFTTVRPLLAKSYQSSSSLQREIHSCLYGRNAVSLDDSVQLEVMALRASEIKKVLTNLNANTKGLYDKEDLAKLLIKLEIESQSLSDGKITTIPMFDQSHGNTDIKYVGIDVEINNRKVRFMVDTGATINLIRKSAITSLGLQTETEQIRTVGLGGGGTVAGSKSRIDNILVGDTIVNIEAANLDNESALPDYTSGLLGLNFLSLLGEVVEFDFNSKSFRFGPRNKMLSPLQKRKFFEVTTRRIQSGLVAADVYVDGGPTPYTAMIDMGNVHTIANSLAVKAISGVPLSSLPVSPMMCQGIDGNPVSMRTFVVNEIKVGQEFVTVGPLSMYAADIPGMFQIGLGNSPSFVLGMDVIRKNRLMFDFEKNRMYMMKQ